MKKNNLNYHCDITLNRGAIEVVSLRDCDTHIEIVIPKNLEVQITENISSYMISITKDSVAKYEHMVLNER